VRCTGFFGSNNQYAHCTRDEHAGGLPLEPRSRSYAHWLGGECRCGITHGQVHHAPVSLRAESKPTPPPPAEEVAELWSRSLSVEADEQVSNFLLSRELDPLVVADRDLARALPLNGTLYKWAGCGHVDWSQSRHRCLIPMFDSSGNLTSLRGRSVVPGAERKELAPGGYAAKHLLAADAGAQHMLAIGELFGPLWIVEGTIDFLTVATMFSDSALVSVIGIINGAWTPEIAARIPDGADVVVAVHGDTAGQGYVDEVVPTLKGRVDLRGFRMEAA
jgi:hypothetical protein